MAIDELLDEREQGERVKAWLRDNSLGLIGGLVLGGALFLERKRELLGSLMHAVVPFLVPGVAVVLLLVGGENALTGLQNMITVTALPLSWWVRTRSASVSGVSRGTSP